MRGDDRMAGHSHAKNVMFRKGKSDAVRSKVFSKLAREITVAAKLGMPDPAFNSRLALPLRLTENPTPPPPNVRSTFDKNGGSLGATNSVAFMFDHVGEIEYPAK